MGYTGQPYRPGPNEASEIRIGKAARGRQGNMFQKVEQIANYIRIAAKERHGGDIRLVRCPSAAEWAELSSGWHAVLPTEMQLTVHADPRMQEVASRRGGMRQAYFAVAKGQILKPPETKPN